MKKLLLTMFFVVTFFCMSAASASAVVNDVIKVGLRYGSDAVFSANLENAVGEGYYFGYFDENRDFMPVGWTEETTVSMTAAGDIYMDESGNYSREIPEDSGYYSLGQWRVQLYGFDSYDMAAEYAAEYGGWPAWINGEYVVRLGPYSEENYADAETLAEELGGEPVAATSTGIVVTKTNTEQILFEFDHSGILALGVWPEGMGDDPVTWFKGNRYYGGFEYPRVTGGDLNVINVLNLEDYVKGVIPYEMSPSWALSALEAQAIVARTYACRDTRHQSAYGFDMCNTTDCQVYYGVGRANATTDEAVDNTAGLRMYYQGDMVQTAVYHNSNGGATEDCANVWGENKPYLIGKEDPYEAQIEVPGNSYSVTYTASELTDILEQKGYTIGKVKKVYVSEFSSLGNVKKVTFEGSKGSKTVSGDTCRTIFYSSTYNKSVKSMRYTINGVGPNNSTVYVNDRKDQLSMLDGISVLSGSGTLSTLKGEIFTILSASGTNTVQGGGSLPTGSNTDEFVIAGTGSGHNVGMSQYGAKAMAELGYTFMDILNFYYTDITVK